MRLIIRFLLIVACCTAGTVSAAESYELLFAKHMGKLTVSDMKSIALTLGYNVTPDGKGLEDPQGCGVVEYETSIVDLNRDASPEVLIIAGNTCTSGNTGSSVFLFVKSKAGKYEMNLDFPASEVHPLSSKSKGFPDLAFGGPSFCNGVWQWNGEKYSYKCSREEKAGACAARGARNLCIGR